MARFTAALHDAVLRICECVGQVPSSCGRYQQGMCPRVKEARTSDRRAYRITRRPDDGEFKMIHKEKGDGDHLQ
jgi:hypothetical protein